MYGKLLMVIGNWSFMHYTDSIGGNVQVASLGLAQALAPTSSEVPPNMVMVIVDDAGSVLN